MLCIKCVQFHLLTPANNLLSSTKQASNMIEAHWHTLLLLLCCFKSLISRLMAMGTLCTILANFPSDVTVSPKCCFTNDSKSFTFSREFAHSPYI